MVAPIVNVSWLHEHCHNPDIVIIDVRPPPYFLQGHVPGAVNLPIFFLAGPGGPPESRGLAQRLGALGIRPSAHLVAYDDGASLMAARLFWVMTYLGHAATSILDGGITAWAREGQEYSYQAASRAPVPYAFGDPDRSVRATLDDVRAALSMPDCIVLDVRTPAEYLGVQVTAARDGHIPGAVNIDAHTNLQRSDDGVERLLSETELRALYETAGVSPEKRVIVHCQSGHRSSETFLVLRSLGFNRVENYDAGWQEWGNRLDTPVETP